MAQLGTTAEVKALVFDSVYKRAQDIVGSNKLLNVTFEGDLVEKGSAECIGSTPSDIYRLSVTVNSNDVKGKCSCPAGAKAKSGLCKHVVALLLERAQEALPNAILSKSSQDYDPSDASFVENISTQTQVPPPMSLNAKNSSEGKGAVPSTLFSSSVPAPKQSHSKRTLPTWMLDNSTAPKSKKRATVVNVPHPPLPTSPHRSVSSLKHDQFKLDLPKFRSGVVHAPLPSKRRTRFNKNMKLSNVSDEDEKEEDQDPGEIEDVEPMDDDGGEVEVPKSIASPVGNVAVRGTRKLRLAEEEKAGDASGHQRFENAQAKRGRERGTSSNSKEETLVQKGRSRRGFRKLVEVDSDLSENETVTPDHENAVKLQDLLDDDLRLVAQKQVPSVRISPSLLESRQDAQANKNGDRQSQGKVALQKQSKGKKSSIFSMDLWKDSSSESGSRSLTSDSLDLETLKTYSLGGELPKQCQVEEQFSEGKGEGNELSPGMQTLDCEGKETTSFVTTESHDSDPVADKDAVANEILDLFLGPSLTASMNVKDTSLAVEIAQNNPPFCHDGGIGFVVPEGPSTEEGNSGLCSAPCHVSVIKSNDDLIVESKPKKKSSLRDRIKMLLD